MSANVRRSVIQAAVVTFVAAMLSGPIAHAQVKGNFDDADVNHDGHVTFEEFAAYATKRLMESNGRMAMRFRQLTPEQQTARLRRRFDRLDKGHKGYLDRKDWSGR